MAGDKVLVAAVVTAIPRDKDSPRDSSRSARFDAIATASWLDDGSVLEILAITPLSDGTPDFFHVLRPIKMGLGFLAATAGALERVAYCCGLSGNDEVVTATDSP